VATPVVKSIGTATRDYSTIQAFEDAIPASIVATDETWTGETYNDSEFSAGTTFSGTTTDATHWITLTTATGESFIDDAGAASNPLKYDQSKGVGIKVTAAYTQAINISTQYVTLEKIQIWRTSAGGSNRVIIAGNNTTINNNILYQENTFEAVSLASSGSKIINSLIITKSTGGTGLELLSGAGAYNVTVASPSDVTNSGTGIVAVYANNIVKNCCSFGFNTDYSASGWDTTNSSYNASDSTGNPGGNSQDSLTYANQFENTTSASHDFRLKAGSDLEGNGTRDATNTGDLDIIGQARSTTTPDIGCWEYQAAAGAISNLAGSGGLAGQGSLIVGPGGLAG